MKNHRAPSTFKNIPDELKIHIAQFLSTRDLLRLMLVSKAWRDVVVDHQTWQNRWNLFKEYVLNKYDGQWPNHKTIDEKHFLPKYKLLLILQKNEKIEDQPIFKHSLCAVNPEFLTCWCANLPCDSIFITNELLRFIFELAVEAGNLTLVKWLFQQKKFLVHPTTLNMAAKIGNQALVEWLVKVCHFTPNEETLNNSAVSGNLRLVQWLCNQHHLNPKERTLIWSLNFTGNLPLVKWLIEEKKLDTPESTLSNAARSGNMELVQWLIAEKRFKPDNDVLFAAASSGNLLLLQWLADNKRFKYEKFSYFDSKAERIQSRAAESGNLELAKWVMKKKWWGPSGNFVFGQAIWSGNLELVQWLATEFQLSAGYGDYTEAARFGNISLLQWLMNMEQQLLSKRDINYEATRGAAEGGSIRVMKWLIEHRQIVPDQNVLHCAIINGNFALVRWLMEDRKLMPDYEWLNKDHKSDYVEIFLPWLKKVMGQQESQMNELKDKHEPANKKMKL